MVELAYEQVDPESAIERFACHLGLECVNKVFGREWVLGMVSREFLGNTQASWAQTLFFYVLGMDAILFSSSPSTINAYSYHFTLHIRNNTTRCMAWSRMIPAHPVIDNLSESMRAWPIKPATAPGRPPAKYPGMPPAMAAWIMRATGLHPALPDAIQLFCIVKSHVTWRATAEMSGWPSPTNAGLTTPIALGTSHHFIVLSWE